MFFQFWITEITIRRINSENSRNKRINILTGVVYEVCTIINQVEYFANKREFLVRDKQFLPIGIPKITEINIALKNRDVLGPNLTDSLSQLAKVFSSFSDYRRVPFPGGIQKGLKELLEKNLKLLKERIKEKDEIFYYGVNVVNIE
ncbi:hypothetical protein JW978_03525 [Candidatus Dojkabacteria bacterium]|nr:hypothetical protein [Candidatus Dojkabacteria bacterium]